MFLLLFSSLYHVWAINHIGWNHLEGKQRESKVAAKTKLSHFFLITTYFTMAKKRGLSADEKRQKMLQSMLEGVMFTHLQ